MTSKNDQPINFLLDPRFNKAIDLFNSSDWYIAHDAFEEIWYETNGSERMTIQGIIQIAVAQVHLERGNKKGATILYGEGLGRLRSLGVPDLGLDIDKLCACVEKRLTLLQREMNLDDCALPILSKKYNSL